MKLYLFKSEQSNFKKVLFKFSDRSILRQSMKPAEQVRTKIQTLYL